MLGKKYFSFIMLFIMFFGLLPLKETNAQENLPAYLEKNPFYVCSAMQYKDKTYIDGFDNDFILDNTTGEIKQVSELMWSKKSLDYETGIIKTDSALSAYRDSFYEYSLSENKLIERYRDDETLNKIKQDILSYYEIEDADTLVWIYDEGKEYGWVKYTVDLGEWVYYEGIYKDGEIKEIEVSDSILYIYENNQGLFIYNRPYSDTADQVLGFIHNDTNEYYTLLKTKEVNWINLEQFSQDGSVFYTGEWINNEYVYTYFKYNPQTKQYEKQLRDVTSGFGEREPFFDANNNVWIIETENGKAYASRLENKQFVKKCEVNPDAKGLAVYNEEHLFVYGATSDEDGWYTIINLKLEQTPVEPQVSFSDIDTHWSKDFVLEFAGKGFINGYSDGTFGPDNSITRAEFVKIVNNAFGFTEKADIQFTDIEREWQLTNVAIGVKAGYLTATNSEFRPDAPITRQEACKIVGMITNAQGDGVLDFADTDQMSEWAKPYIDALVDVGVITKKENFRPLDGIRRGEAVKILSLAMKL